MNQALNLLRAIWRDQVIGFTDTRVQIFELQQRLASLEALCERIELAVTPPKAVRFVFLIEGEEVDQMQMKVSDKLKVKLAIKDKGGNLAEVDGAPAWSLTDENLGSLEVAEDGMSADFTPAGSVGGLKVQVSADADLGEGVKTIFGELQVDLLPGEAVSLELSGEVAVEAPPAEEGSPEA